MQRILLGLGTIVFVGAVAVASTGAFFSDTETSTGNTFTAGAIDLTVDSTQHYNNAVCVNGTWQLFGENSPAVDQYPVIGSACDGTWTATDLGVANKFFNFGDVKPGDQGENTVSLHVENNPAYACVDIGTNQNNENTLIEPEATAGDITSDPNGGELAQNITMFAWLDNASTSGAVVGDNIWQAGEPILQQPVALSALSATTTLTLADGANGTPLPGGTTSYIGLAWCAGTLTIGAPGSWSCNGASMGNTTQTDSVLATVQFRVEQARNNSAFRCVPQLVEQVQG